MLIWVGDEENTMRYHVENVPTEEAETILKAGLNSTNKSVCQRAARAHENLLHGGISDLLDLVG